MSCVCVCVCEVLHLVSPLVSRCSSCDGLYYKTKVFKEEARGKSCEVLMFLSLALSVWGPPVGPQGSNTSQSPRGEGPRE